MIWAGLPPASVFAGISPGTTDPAATTEFLPILLPGSAGRLAAPPSRTYGSSTVDPVVLRPTRSVWAWPASASA
jgi:hypothetical protein